MRAFVILALLVGVPLPAAAESKAAEQLFSDGKRHLAKKDYARACSAFEASYAAEAAIGTQLNIGLCYEKRGKWGTAYTAYQRALEMAREENDDRFSDIRKLVEKTGRKIARLAVKVPPDTKSYVLFMLDGKTIDRGTLADLVVEPGMHTIAARIPGQPLVSKTVEVAVGERVDVALDVPRTGTGPRSESPLAAAKPAAGTKLSQSIQATKPTRAATERSADEDKATDNEDEAKADEDKDETEKTADEDKTADKQTPELQVAIDRGPGRSPAKLYGGIAMVTVGVAAVGVASYIALDARSAYKAAAKQCPNDTCATQEAHEATTEARARARQMTYMFVGGVGLALVGTYLIGSSKRKAPDDDGVRVSLVFSGRDAMFVVGGRL